MSKLATFRAIRFASVAIKIAALAAFAALVVHVI
jgi:hypothetical protein